jgi:hypothetical protein
LRKANGHGTVLFNAGFDAKIAKADLATADAPTATAIDKMLALKQVGALAPPSARCTIKAGRVAQSAGLVPVGSGVLRARTGTVRLGKEPAAASVRGTRAFEHAHCAW